MTENIQLCWIGKHKESLKVNIYRNDNFVNGGKTNQSTSEKERERNAFTNERLRFKRVSSFKYLEPDMSAKKIGTSVQVDMQKEALQLHRSPWKLERKTYDPLLDRETKM